MKKSIVFITMLLVFISAVYFTACNNNAVKTQVVNKDDSISDVIERGKYLANHVAACIHCHSMRDFNKYAGPVIAGTEGGGGGKFDHSILDAIPGTLYSKNITPDKETGIGDWTDAEILRAITQGINKKGDTLFPLMPYATFNKMAKADLLSIIAYLHTLKPIKNKVPARQLMIPISAAYPGPALQQSVDANILPGESDKVKYGQYLITMADCAGCHTPYVKGQTDLTRLFGGGNTFHIPNCTVNSANISPDSATGIGNWTEAMFMMKFTDCRSEKGYNYNPGKKNTVMPLVDFAGMKDSDLKAIYAYLRTVKPVINKVQKYPE